MNHSTRIGRTFAALAAAASVTGCLEAQITGSGGASNGGSASVPLTFPSGQTVSANRDVASAANSKVLAQNLLAYGGKPANHYTWTLTQTPPFTGLAVDSVAGTITGTVPANITAGSYFFNASVNDAYSTNLSGYFTVVVTSCDSSPTRPSGFPACPTATLASGNGTSTPISINNAVGLTQIPTQAPFGFALHAIGGLPPYKSWTWSAVSPANTLPPGLTLDPTSGIVWGTPLSTNAGTTYTFDVTVTDANNTASPGSRYTLSF
jgi:Putative Ig domain